MACAVSWPTLRHRQNSFPAFFEAPHLQNIHAFAFCFRIYGPDRCFFYQTNSKPMHTHTHTHTQCSVYKVCVFVCVYIHIRGVTVRFDTTQWCHGSVSFWYGERDNWSCRNVGNISVLNHEGELMDIKQARICTRVCTMKIKCKIYAGEHPNRSFHYKQKVKVKT